MKRKRSTSKSTELRTLAENKLKDKKKKKQKLSVEEEKELIHKLQVHQIELEMQNEELRTAQEDLEQSRSRYADLYDFAPVGYFTFDKNGLILDVNLTGAGQLGMERGLIIKKPFSRFIKKEDQDLFYFHRQQVFKTKARESCQVKIVRKEMSLIGCLLPITIIVLFLFAHPSKIHHCFQYFPLELCFSNFKVKYASLSSL